MGDGSGRRSGHGSGRLSGHRFGRLSGGGNSGGSRRLVGGSQRARSVSSHCDDVFQEKVNLALQDIEKGTGKMHFALRGHYESMFALGCHVGFVEKCGNSANLYFEISLGMNARNSGCTTFGKAGAHTNSNSFP